MFITLKPLAERKISADQVIGRLRGKLAVVPGATLYMQSAQDLTIGGRMGQAQYQYTLQGENLDEMNDMGAAFAPEAAFPAAVARRQHRPAGQGTASQRGH